MLWAVDLRGETKNEAEVLFLNIIFSQTKTNENLHNQPQNLMHGRQSWNTRQAAIIRAFSVNLAIYPNIYIRMHVVVEQQRISSQ